MTDLGDRAETRESNPKHWRFVLQDENAALREALKPFAKRLSDWEAGHPTGKYPWRDATRIEVRLGDLRNAARALANKPSMSGQRT